MQKDIILSSCRLSLLMEYVDSKNINLIEKIIICDFLNEIAYRVCGKINIFLQTLGNGFNAGCVLSRTQPAFHTPTVGVEKVRKIVIFRLFPHPL